MIILFYSDRCNFCVKLLKYIELNQIESEFKLINIDSNKSIPPQIKAVPTIIDKNITVPLEGKKAFDYVYNKKFFNYSTNNINNWKNKTIPKPKVEEDKKARDPLMKNNCRDFDKIKSDGTINNVTHSPKKNDIRLKKLLNSRNIQDNLFKRWNDNRK